MISSFTKYLLLLVIVINVTISATSSKRKNEKPTIQLCSNERQLLTATNMCTMHGKPGIHLACICQDNIPICVTTDMSSGNSQSSICKDIVYELCIYACASPLVAIKCEGMKSSRCLTMEGDVKKGLLSSI